MARDRFAVEIVSTDPFAQDAAVRLHAAGSLRTVMGELVQAFGTATGRDVVPSFGASGLLRERIE